jgi:subtilisin family serine protease
MIAIPKACRIVLGAILLSAAFCPADSLAQLRGLGGVGPIGSGPIGSGLPGPGSIGPGPAIPSTPSLPTGGIGGNVSSALPGVSSTGLPTGQITSTVTNTLNGDVVRPLSKIGGAVTNTAGRIGGNAAGAVVRQARSRVPPVGERRFVSDEVLLGLPSNLTPQALDALARRHDLVRLESQKIGLTGTTFHRWRIADGRSAADIVRELEADRGVRMAQPNYRFALQQSAVAGDAPQAPDFEYSAAKLRLPQAHEFATGGQVLVAVIDGRVDASHPEFAGGVVESVNATEAADADDAPAGHATAMAGAIIAHARLMGVAPAARILAIRAFSSAGGRNESTTLAILKSIDLAVARHARVINMSFAGPLDPEIQRSLAAAYRKGIVLIAAAGNAGPKSPPLYPAADPNVIAVTATDSADHLFARSNRGRYIAVAAPGVDVIAPAPREAYQMTTGTSVATAEVSGIAALLIGVRPTLTPQAVRQALVSTARHLGPAGSNDEFGAGLADAYRAVLLLTAGATAAKTTSVSAAR